MLDLFSDTPPWQEPLAPGAVVLRRFARERAPALLQAIADVASQSPFRQMVTPGGYTMSVAMTNCGALGWTTDRHGYLYAPVDPVTDQTWPPMPAVFHELALAAAAAGGYPEFSPDACLINRYCLAQNCRCIRIKMNRICGRRLSRSRWACRPSFSLAACNAATRCSGCCWSMAMWWSGAASRACFIMAFSR